MDAGGILFSDKATWEIMTKMLKNLSRNGGKYGSLENVGIGIYLYRERGQIWEYVGKYCLNWRI